MKPVPLRTDEAPSKGFPAHGLVAYSGRGRCLYCEATGPFNAELVQVMARDMLGLFAQMAEGGPWVHLARFHVSALASPETLAQFSAFLADLNARGQVPEASAYVLPSEVEGAYLMARHFQRCFEAAGLVFAAFETDDAARQWLASRHPELPLG